MSSTDTTEPCKDPVAEIYIADPDLKIAAEVALELGQPLLLTGEPGTGKTSFANYLAGKLAPRWFAGPDAAMPPTAFDLYKFETKSSSVATDLFYRFDNLRRFHAIHNKELSQVDLDYITFEALGKAILHSLPRNSVSDLLRPNDKHPGPCRSVVLVDEIDKAPRDFPNDLLNEIDRMFFRLPELPPRERPGGREIRTVTADKAWRPIVVLTSNSEKNLPAAFLRRCVFHHIRFPERARAERLGEIVEANLGQAIGTLARDAIAFFYDLREGHTLDKPPTTYELVQWIRILQSRRWPGLTKPAQHARLSELPLDDLKATLGTIAKTADDLAKVQVQIVKRGGPGR